MKSSEEILLEDMAKYKFTALPLRKQIFSQKNILKTSNNDNTSFNDINNPFILKKEINAYSKNLENNSRRNLVNTEYPFKIEVIFFLIILKENIYTLLQ